MFTNNFLPRLQFITGTNPRMSHAEEARQACKGGIRFIQFREKQASLENCKRMAETTYFVCREYNAYLIIDDKIEVAKDIKADGVHLGYEDESPDKAREILGKNAIIGGTGNSFDHVKSLSNSSVDYIGLGPYRSTNTKDRLKPLLGIEGYKNLKQQMDEAGIAIPIYAIGGIQVNDVPDILDTGIYGVAVASAIGNQPDPFQAANDFAAHIVA